MRTEEGETPSSSAMMMDPWSLFIYGMKAPMTREKYTGRLAKFFDFIGHDVGTRACKGLHRKGQERAELGISYCSAICTGSERKSRKWRDKPGDS